MKKSPHKSRTNFLKLASEAGACLKCESMVGRSAVLSELNGSLEPKVLFIAEAPGRQGADRTRKPFYGDKSGENFEKYLESIGLLREEIFITNTVLCSPRSDSGANRKPKSSEIRNCGDFLIRTIDILDPPVVVTLGSVALDATRRIEHHQIRLRDGVGKMHKWNGRTLIPLYHPSPQVIASSRRFEEQLADFSIVRDAIEG